MANIIGFGLDIAINVAVLAEAFGSTKTGPAVVIGIGSEALGQDASNFPLPDKETPAGPLPSIELYDVHGKNFAIDDSLSDIGAGDNQRVTFSGGTDSDDLARNPEYSEFHSVFPHTRCELIDDSSAAL